MVIIIAGFLTDFFLILLFRVEMKPPITSRHLYFSPSLSAYVLNSNSESPLAVAISAQNLNAALSILSFGGQPVAPSNFVADPDSPQSTFASPLFRAFKMMLDDGRYEKSG